MCTWQTKKYIHSSTTKLSVEHFNNVNFFPRVYFCAFLLFFFLHHPLTFFFPFFALPMNLTFSCNDFLFGISHGVHKSVKKSGKNGKKGKIQKDFTFVSQILLQSLHFHDLLWCFFVFVPLLASVFIASIFAITTTAVAAAAITTTVRIYDDQHTSRQANSLFFRCRLNECEKVRKQNQKQ